MRTVELNGTNERQLSFVTTANAVRATGFLKLEGEIKKNGVRIVEIKTLLYLRARYIAMPCDPLITLKDSCGPKVPVIAWKVMNLIGEQLTVKGLSANGCVESGTERTRTRSQWKGR